MNQIRENVQITMRVCFISFEFPPKVIGGLGIHAEHLVKGLVDNHVDVFTITRGTKDAYGSNIVKVRTPEILYWQRLFFINRAMKILAGLKGKYVFDLVHLNGSYPLLHHLKVPTVTTFHSTNFTQIGVTLRALSSVRRQEISSLVLKNPVGSLADILSVRISDLMICPSYSISNEIQIFCGASREKIQIIPNGLDFELLDKEEGLDLSVSEEYGVERNRFLLYVGRLTYLKGVDYLINAFKEVIKNFGDLKLIIMGTGPLDSYLKNIAKDTEQIVFTGHVNSQETKRLLYENCLALVVPSLHETLPTVIMEAMWFGKPVIATKVGGNPDLVRDGENGFLIEPKNSKAIADCIKTFAQTPSLAEEMGKRGRESAKKEFSVERMIDRTLTAYDTLLQRNA